MVLCDVHLGKVLGGYVTMIPEGLCLCCILGIL